MSNPLVTQARAIWQAAVDAVRADVLVRQALADIMRPGSDSLLPLEKSGKILVLGGGKAGAAMSAAVEDCLAGQIDRLEGVVNVPAELVRPLRRIRLCAARPAGSNHPTLEGVAGTEEILRLARQATSQDVALCLLSGGGSALLPAPAPGVTLADKQDVTRLLHACGATINQMNAVRKHLSAFKGGRLAQAFTGKAMISLIISDVVGDPLDVIASGPTAADPTTFADALAVLDRYSLRPKAPRAVIAHLERGARGEIVETLKTLPANIHNRIIGNNVQALAVAEAKARQLGFNVLNLGSYLEGETKHVAGTLMGLVRSIAEKGIPFAPPACIVSGGETTVTLPDASGKGGRNQEFVLASLIKLGEERMHEIVILSGGTDGEDGPTDAAGAVAHAGTLAQAQKLGLNPASFLERHDAYPFFKATGDLLVTGLTQTNVMDVRIILISGKRQL
jgi:glycerate 2-kinase